MWTIALQSSNQTTTHETFVNNYSISSLSSLITPEVDADKNSEYEVDATVPDCEDCQPSLADRSLRLTGGRDEYEGNVEVYHSGVWGGVCDDEWDLSEAEIVCHQLGYPGAITATHGGKFGHTPSVIWMDNLYCYGTEKELDRCRFDGWGVHDCDRSEAAGVRCKQPPALETTSTTTTPRPKIPIRNKIDTLEVRLVGGRVEDEGRVEVRMDNRGWGVICGDGWGVREAMVACRQLGLGYAAASLATSVFGGSNVTRVMSGVTCRGHEASLLDCDHDDDLWCPAEGVYDVASVMCTDTQADLKPDMMQLMQSAYLEDKSMFLLQCAMEENCLATGAYTERQENPHWQQLTRRLLRFTTAIANIGSADFRPFIPKEAWQWHACHQVLK